MSALNTGESLTADRKDPSPQVTQARLGLLDGSAISLSGLCIAHCLALPLVAAIAPMAAAGLGAEWVHLIFVLLAAPIGAVALLWPVRGQRPPTVMLAAGALGVSLLVVGLLVEPQWETAATVAGGFGLATAHILNWHRRARSHPQHL